MKASLVEFQQLTVGIKEGQWMGERGKKERGGERERERERSNDKGQQT
jgi:hypothetical protein